MRVERRRCIGQRSSAQAHATVLKTVWFIRSLMSTLICEHYAHATHAHTHTQKLTHDTHAHRTDRWRLFHNKRKWITMYTEYYDMHVVCAVSLRQQQPARMLDTHTRHSHFEPRTLCRVVSVVFWCVWSGLLLRHVKPAVRSARQPQPAHFATQPGDALQREPTSLTCKVCIVDGFIK